MNDFTLRELQEWCRVPYQELEHHPGRKVPFRLCRDSAEMGEIMAAELVDEIRRNNEGGAPTRAIIPCGPSCWYKPFTTLVNREGVSLRNLVVFHMDECLDWQGRELPRSHPYNFRGFMERHFYAPVEPSLAAPESQRIWLVPGNVVEQETVMQAVLVDTRSGVILGTATGTGRGKRIVAMGFKQIAVDKLSQEVPAKALADLQTGCANLIKEIAASQAQPAPAH